MNSILAAHLGLAAAVAAIWTFMLPPFRLRRRTTVRQGIEDERRLQRKLSGGR